MSSPFVFDGCNLALDLVNTRPFSSGARIERLSTPGDLDAWLVAAGVHEPGAVRGLSVRLRERLLLEAHALRDAIESCVTAFRDRTEAPSGAVETINDILATNRRSSVLSVTPEGFERSETSHPSGASALLEPVAEAALELLTEAAPEHVKQCDDPECVLWFLDATRNGARRWCSMSRCGNRAKAAAHYRRTRARAGRPRP